jgi:hypothetical protein
MPLSLPPVQAPLLSQLKPAGQLIWHDAPHWCCTPPPPQVCPLEQLPHDSVCPQPSEIDPHVAPSALQLVGEQEPVPHTFA